MNLKPLAQEAAWKTLLHLAKAGLPQSLILIGPAGIGKRRSAQALFQWINCTARGEADEGTSLFGAAEEPSENAAALDSPCGECVACKKIAAGNHVDFTVIKPDGDFILVDDLREMKKSLFFAPAESRLRFVVIDQAHRLNASSANALLKTLEEPPAHTRFFLITHERGLLPATLVSRSQFLHFAPLTDEILRQLLAGQGIEISPRLESLCFALLNGGLERANLLSDEKTLRFLEELSQRASRVQTAADVLELSEVLSADKTKLELFLDFLLILARKQAEDFSRLPGSNPLALLQAFERAGGAAFLRERLERHANAKLMSLAAAELAQNSQGRAGA